MPKVFIKPVWWVVLLLAAELAPSLGQTNPACVVCGTSPLSGQVWKHRWGLVCADCIGLDARCSLCGLPVKQGFARTADGRLICSFDASNAVLTVTEAARVFAETAQELERLTDRALSLASTNITVQLFDVDYWSRSADGIAPAEQRQIGFAHSRRVNGEWAHLVGLLSGRPKTEIQAACAHEFTHLWINENKAGARLIEKDTAEAICELAAYKLMGARHDSAQQEAIQKNTYTHGLIEILIEAETRGGLETVLDWVKTGTGAKFDIGTMYQFRADAAAAAARIIQVPRTNPAPDRLVLRGLFGTPQRRQAMINDRTFLRNDEKTVRVGNQSIPVRCLEIRDQSVIVRIEGAPTTLELTIGNP